MTARSVTVDSSTVVSVPVAVIVSWNVAWFRPTRVDGSVSALACDREPVLGKGLLPAGSPSGLGSQAVNCCFRPLVRLATAASVSDFWITVVDVALPPVVAAAFETE